MEKSKSLLSRVYGCIRKIDIFTSRVNLRYEDEYQYETFAGGIASIILFGLLFGAFFNAWIELFDQTDITFSTVVSRQSDPVGLITNTNQFLFALGFTGLNISEATQNFFNLSLAQTTVVNYENGTSTKVRTNIPLSPCPRSQWQSFGDEFGELYDRQTLGNFLCPPANTSIFVEGKYTSANFNYYKISVTRCTASNCPNDTAYQQYISTNAAFSLNFYYTNTLINPGDTSPLSTFFEDKDYMMISSSLGKTKNFYLQSYQMVTDESLMPWTSPTQQDGYLIDRSETEFESFIPMNTTQATIYIRKSDTSTAITRQFRKIDDMLSYIGGLFGLIAVFVGFFLKAYSQFCLEIQMSNHIFEHQEKSQIGQTPYGAKQQNVQNIQQDRQIHLSIGRFLMILLFKLMRLLGFKPRWKSTLKYYESLEEMRNHLDATTLVQKIAFYDKSFNILFDQNQLKLLHLQERYKLSEIKKERLMLKLRQNVADNLAYNINLFEQNSDCVNSPHQIQNSSPQNQIIRSTICRNRTFNKLQFLNRINEENDKKRKRIPLQILQALNEIKDRMQSGDQICRKIYEGINSQLINAYQEEKSIKSNQKVESVDQYILNLNGTIDRPNKSFQNNELVKFIIAKKEAKFSASDS